MTSRKILFAALPLVVAAFAVGPTFGQGASVILDGPGLSAAEIAKVQPWKNLLRAPDTSRLRAQPAPARRKTPALVQGNESGADEPPAPYAYGSFGLPYTSTRVALGRSNQPFAPNYLHTTFPYRAIGKLTFQADFGNSYCSASLIRRSVLVTAAHCIQPFGGGNVLHRNFQFTPGFYSTSPAFFSQSTSYGEPYEPPEVAPKEAPYGVWNAAYIARPPSWAKGTDVGSGSARDNDVAVIILHKNRAGKFVGQRTGWLSYAVNNYGFVASSRTGGLEIAATTTLGYPVLLDSGNIMQRVDGPTFTTTIGGAGQMMQGNDFTAGSSGGPWIVNFGAQRPVRAGGAEAGRKARMAVVGVTSWGSSDPNAPKDNFASQFRQNSAYPNADYSGYGPGNIGALVAQACNAPAGGGRSYEQLGFCD